MKTESTENLSHQFKNERHSGTIKGLDEPTEVRLFDTLTNLKAAIKKRPRLLQKKIVLLYDNAASNTTVLFQKLLNNFKWQIFPYPTYAQDLTPKDFHLFLGLESELSGGRFSNAITSYKRHRSFQKIGRDVLL